MAEHMIQCCFPGCGPFGAIPLPSSSEPASSPLYLDRAGSAHFSLEDALKAPRRAPHLALEQGLAVAGALASSPPSRGCALAGTAAQSWAVLMASIRLEEMSQSSHSWVRMQQHHQEGLGHSAQAVAAL